MPTDNTPCAGGARILSETRERIRARKRAIRPDLPGIEDVSTRLNALLDLLDHFAEYGLEEAARQRSVESIGRMLSWNLMRCEEEVDAIVQMAAAAVDEYSQAIERAWSEGRASARNATRDI